MLRPGSQDSYISGKVNMPTAKSHAELVREVEPRIKAQSFFSARVAEAHILDRLREVSDGYSRGEFGLGEARNRLKDFLRAEGYDPHQGGMRNLASTGRLNLILKQNAAMAHSAAEWQRMHDPDAMKVYPYVRYHARSDNRTRSEHAHLDGRIFRKDDPFLSTHTPPWEFNCRCWLEEITDREAGKTPDLIQPPTPADKVTVDSKSGFQFDPAHAFEKFDFNAIKDPGLRENAREGVEKILAGKVPDQPAKPAEPVGIEGNYTDGERKSIRYAVDKIGDAKREHLLVFDSQGKLEYQETGTKHHAGYATENISYEGKIVVHNHPKGNYPFFSQQDLDTFHSKHIQTAAVVSRDYVVTIQRDEEYKHEPMKIDITNGRDFRNMNIRTEINDLYRQLRRAKTESEFHDLRDRYIQLNLQYQADMASEAGYKISWCKREDAEHLLAGKPDQSSTQDPDDFKAKLETVIKKARKENGSLDPETLFTKYHSGLSGKKIEEIRSQVHTAPKKAIESLAQELEKTITPEMQKDIKAEKTREQCVAEAAAAVPPEVMQRTVDYAEKLPEGSLDPLFKYTNKDEDGVNKALRKNTQTPEETAKINAFAKLLENGPKYHGVCFRGCYFDSEEQAKKFVKTLFDSPEELKGFTSLSPDFASALYYAEKGTAHVIIVIPESTHGVYWGPYSSQPRDHETTLNCKFYLKGLAFCKKGDKLYVLAEEAER